MEEGVLLPSIPSFFKMPEEEKEEGWHQHELEERAAKEALSRALAVEKRRRRDKVKRENKKRRTNLVSDPWGSVSTGVPMAGKQDWS